MAITAPFKLDKIRLPSTVDIDVVSNATIDAGISNFTERPAGHVSPMFTGNQAQKPMVEFTTPQLDVLLGAVTLAGVSAGTISLYLKAATVTGNTARATTAHKKIDIASSCLYWTSLRLPHNGQAEITARIQAAFDGTNDPFVYGGSVAVPSTLSAGTFFGAGPVSLNGTTLPAVQSITVDSGINMIQAGGESEEFDTFIGIESSAPVVTIQFLQEVNWSSIGLRGTTLNGTTGLVFYGRKYANKASRVANATAEHIKFTVLNGVANPVNTTGQRSSLVSDTLRIHAIAGTDSVLPLTVSTASAIT
jgi:hypothetical protein